MGRSVSFASHSEIVAYIDCSTFGYREEIYCEECGEYSDFDGSAPALCPCCSSEDITDKSDEYNDCQGQSDWDFFTEDLHERLTNKYPSLSSCDEWLHREDHAILENDLVYVGISEYCGLVSLWVTPKAHFVDCYDKDTTALAVSWCNRIKEGFLNEFSDLKKVGCFSNGECVFERTAA